MKTPRITPEQMRSRIARFSERRVHPNHLADADIPQAALDLINPPLYLLLAHAAEGVPEDARPAIAGAKGMSVSLADCPPGGKVPLHIHVRSREVFMCLKGAFKIRWNERGEDETTLAPLDMIDVPIGVYREFQNVSDEPGLLLVIITDEREDEPGDIVIAPEERSRFAERFGEATLEKLTASTGFIFNDPAAE